MSTKINDPIFHDEAKATARRLPDLPFETDLCLSHGGLEGSLIDLITLLDAINVSMPLMLGEAFHRASAHNRIDASCYPAIQFDAQVVHPAQQALEAAAKNEPLRELRLSLRPYKRPDGPPSPPYATVQSAYSDRLLFNATALHFTSYYGRHHKLLKDLQGDPIYWHPVWKFARVVRNAINHGGTINLDGPTAIGGDWYGLRYGYDQRGQSVFDDLSVADLIILMLEMDRALTRIGA